jgi:hypothetical protein
VSKRLILRKGRTFFFLEARFLPGAFSLSAAFFEGARFFLGFSPSSPSSSSVAAFYNRTLKRREATTTIPNLGTRFLFGFFSFLAIFIFGGRFLQPNIKKT